MKIIHCADLHLDSKMSAHLSEEKATERRYEILATFEKMVSYAIQNDIQAIMIAGDMFDTAKNKLKRIKNRVLSLIEKSSEIDFLYLRGNHDNDDFFQNLEYIPNNLKLFSSQWTAYTYNDIVITGLEFNSDITSSSNIYSNLVLNEHNFNIVLLHGQVSLYGDNKREEIINLSKLQNKSIDYLALGHIHSYELNKLDDRGIWCYSGCLEGRGFDECGKKGFVVLNIQNKNLSYEFIPIAERTIHDISIDITNILNTDELMALTHSKIAKIPNKDLLKITLTGTTTEETDLDLDYLIQQTKNSFYVCKISDKTEPKIDYLKYQHDISLKGEFIRTVTALDDISESEKNKIIMLGIHALLGKELKI